MQSMSPLLRSRTCQAARFGNKLVSQTFNQHARLAQSSRLYSQSGPGHRASAAFRFFRVNPRTLALTVGGFGLFCAANIEETPGSGRSRFNWVPASLELKLSQYALQSVLHQYQGKFLPDDSKEVQLVRKVVDRLLPHTGVQNEGQWEVRVIDDPTTNAFVIPGNKVFVFTGMLNVAQTEDGLAVILGHEIAHNVAHHTAENISRSTLVLPLTLAMVFLLDTSAQFTTFLLNTIVQNPGSRQQESEADHQGLLIMSRSCYDPREAVKVWERMLASEEAMSRSGQGRPPPQFLSTHPSTSNRIQKIKEWLPEAMAQLAGSDCGEMSMHAKAFQDTWRKQTQHESFQIAQL